MPERDRLIARIRQLRRPPAAPETATLEQDSTALEIMQARVEQLEQLQARVEQLEQLVEALQDSVHREAQRHEKRMAELEARIQPAALGIALSQDRRDRGL
jgi:hypothetical protein